MQFMPVTDKHGQRPLIMGILNVTPDSFSDGGEFQDHEAAILHGLKMAEEGADIIDVGGESTRPGAGRVDAAEQMRRVIPVISGLRERLPEQILISIDTTQSEVARQAVSAGAGMVNDISAGEDDQGILELAADSGIHVVLMHKRGAPATMQESPEYSDVCAEVSSYLETRVETAVAAGINRELLIIDPGFGFGKTAGHNLQLLAGLERFVATGTPVMIGTSRKSFLASICTTGDRKSLTGATCATTTLGMLAGVRYFRVHDVLPNRQAADTVYSMLQESMGSVSID